MRRLLGVVVLVVVVGLLWRYYANRVPVPPDNSLATEEYLEKGFPAMDRAWTEKEYRAALRVLRKVEDEEVTQLPRFESSKSGEVFAKMTDAGNFSMMPGDGAGAGRYVDSVSLLIKLYDDAGGLSMGEFDMEVVELAGHFLEGCVRASTVLFSEVNIMYEEGFEDADRAERDMMILLAQTVNGALDIFQYEEWVREEAMLRMAEHFGDTLPKLMPVMSAAARENIHKRLGEFIETGSRKKVKKALSELNESLPAP